MISKPVFKLVGFLSAVMIALGITMPAPPFHVGGSRWQKVYAASRW